MATREEKQLEMATEVMLQRVNEMKMSLTSLLLKLDHDHQNVTFPDFLDAFSVISGQMNTLMRLLRSDKVPILKALTVLPLSLSQDPDQALVSTTEGRLPCFNHEVVPDYLRTKPVPEAESKHSAVELRANVVNQDAVLKQMNAMNKMASHVLDLINTARDDWEAAERGGPPPTYSQADTQDLAVALSTGRAFKVIPPQVMARQAAVPNSAAAPALPKGPGPIKTNIKTKKR